MTGMPKKGLEKGLSGADVLGFVALMAFKKSPTPRDILSVAAISAD